jgi:histidine triad (HIT) family protein
MFNHAPTEYKCPVCLGIKGIENDLTLLKQTDLVYKDELVSVFINSFRVDTVKCHVIVVPNEHIENLYEMPENVGHHIFEISKRIAITMRKAYQCDGITTRQNNEPAGDQHAYHFHLHIYPRYDNDLFNENCAKKKVLTTPEERMVYTKLLKEELDNT